MSRQYLLRSSSFNTNFISTRDPETVQKKAVHWIYVPCFSSMSAVRRRRSSSPPAPMADAPNALPPFSNLPLPLRDGSFDPPDPNPCIRRSWFPVRKSCCPTIGGRHTRSQILAPPNHRIDDFGTIQGESSPGRKGEKGEKKGASKQNGKEREGARKWRE